MAKATLPKEFLSSIDRLPGIEVNSFLQALEVEPSVSIRVNPAKQIKPVSDERIPWCKDGYYLSARPSFTHDPLFHAGCYYVQEASSMFLEQAVMQVVQSAVPIKVLDLCAAPGGKSTHLLSLLPPGSVLIANEVIRSRVSVLTMNIEKWGHSNVLVTNSDPEAFGQLKGYFDLILTDAPCSGEGLFRKDSDAISHWSPEHVQLCSARQQRILDNVWPALKEGGHLIYSTCTFNESENEHNLAYFLSRHQGKSISLSIPSNSGIICNDQKGITGYRFYPDKIRGEGFFLSVMKKISDEESISERNKRKNERAFSHEKFKELLKNAEQFFLKEKNELILALPFEVNDVQESISRFINIIHSGVALGELKHGKIIPSHALALSNDYHRGTFSEVELSEEDALKFLKKDTLQPVGAGMTLFTHQRFGLGWGNVVSGRINNLVPNSWRILK